MQRADLGWAVIRVVAGSSLAAFHGYKKVFLGGVNGLAGSVANLGIPFPLFNAWVASLAEFVGGILLAFGLATRGAGLFIAGTMAVAMYSHRNDPLQKMELAAIFCAIAVAAMLMGSGRYGLDSKIKLRMPIGSKGE